MEYLLGLPWQEIGAWLMALLAGSTALAHVFQRGARAFERYAISTSTKNDDAIASKMVRVADSIAAFLDASSAYLPRIGVKGRS